MPVAFFDGTLLFSTARMRVDANIAPPAYVGAISKAIELSRDAQVPLVGYIDQSYARDLVRLLDVLSRDARPRLARL
jgi:hypothetical protein